MSDVFKVGKEAVQRILNLLPGKDCAGFGGCGKKTCGECAEAIASGSAVNLCPACSQERVDEIAQVMNAASVEVEPQIAFIACNGDAAGKERFKGCASCQAAKDMGFVRGECKNGCLGLGSCIDVCTFDAMKLEDRKILIDAEKCTGCGACANSESCVQNIIHMIPKDATNFIPCSSCEEDDELVREICGFGCLGCGDCERACPEGAISIVNHHAVIDYEKCVGCVACAVKCKKKIIIDTNHNLAEVKEKVAFVKCSGGWKAEAKFKEMGITDCREAVKKADYKAMELCTTGCTGLGNCTRVCRYDAIHIVNGTARVDTDKCVGCKDCTYACPKNLIVIVPYKGAKMVPCSSTDDYEDKSKVCTSACIACGDCNANCPNGAIYMEEAHAVVDTEICENCQVCQYMCARGIIEERIVPEHTYLQRAALGLDNPGEGV